MKHEVREETQNIKRTEYWHGESEGFEFGISKDENRTQVWITHPGPYNGIRLGIFSSYPKHVSDLEAFAEVASDVLRGICKQMREDGLDDLRGESEKRMDEWKSECDRMVAEMIAKSNQSPHP